MNKDNKDDFTVDESEIDVSRDSDESADNETNQESMHKLMLKRGFRPYPNEKQFDRSIVYAVHKRAKDPQGIFSIIILTFEKKTISYKYQISTNCKTE